MPSKNNIYTVTKVEHEFGLTKIKPRFPKMAELYLELLINKKKVNLTLASEKYIHYYEPIVSSEDSFTGGFKPIPRITSVSKENGITQPLTRDVIYSNDKPQLQPRLRETFNWESSDSMEPSPVIKKKISRPISSSPQVGSISSKTYRKVKKSIISSYYNNSKTAVNNDRNKDRNNDRNKDRNNDRNKDRNNDRIEEESNKEINTQIPPLKEIKKTFGDNKPNINTFTDYEDAKDEDDKKRELLFKFKRLKKTYPKADIPHFDMMSNHENMKRTYDSTMKNLAIDSTVETYKSYLMMGFMGCEIVLGKVGFDMEGYTQQQTLYMNKYEKLLIELGEKSYVPASINKWPVEIRLMALVLFQTTIFIISKIIAKKTNVNLLQMYNSVNGAYESQNRYKSTLNGISSQLPPDGRTGSSGFASGGSSPLTFIPKMKRTASATSESKMKGPSATKD
jgi:hypothetical protein